MAFVPSEQLKDKTVCKKCGVEKPISDFQRSRRRSQGITTWCKGCLSKAQKAWVSKNREGWNRYLASYRRRKKQERNSATPATFPLTSPVTSVTIEEVTEREN